MKQASYHNKYFNGDGKVPKLICRGDKVVIHTNIQNYMVNCFPMNPLHPVMDRTEANISTHY